MVKLPIMNICKPLWNGNDLVSSAQTCRFKIYFLPPCYLNINMFSVIYQRITPIIKSKCFFQSIFFSIFEQKVESILLKSILYAFHIRNIRTWISLCHLTHEVIMIYKEWIGHKTKTYFYWRKGAPKYLFLILYK